MAAEGARGRGEQAERRAAASIRGGGGWGGEWPSGWGCEEAVCYIVRVAGEARIILTIRSRMNGRELLGRVGALRNRPRARIFCLFSIFSFSNN